MLGVPGEDEMESDDMVDLPQVHAFKRSTYDTQMDMKARDEAVLKKISSYPPGKLAKDRKFTYQKVCRSGRFKNKKMCLAPGVCMFFHSAKKGVPPPPECPKPPDSLLTKKAKGLMSMATSWWSKGKVPHSRICFSWWSARAR